jgi:hypothetical protein
MGHSQMGHREIGRSEIRHSEIGRSSEKAVPQAGLRDLATEQHGKQGHQARELAGEVTAGGVEIGADHGA